MILDIFISCCILHNMLLEFDGWDDWNKYVKEDDINDYEEDEFENTYKTKDSFLELVHGMAHRRS